MLSSIKKIALLSPIIKFQIYGSSMIPTLQQGDSILVNRMSYLFRSPNIDDIIALYDPRDRKILIKRIIKIEKGKYFVEGDNKNSSTDSRVFGMIGRVDIIGKIVRKL